MSGTGPKILESSRGSLPSRPLHSTVCCQNISIPSLGSQLEGPDIDPFRLSGNGSNLHIPLEVETLAMIWWQVQFWKTFGSGTVHYDGLFYATSNASPTNTPITCFNECGCLHGTWKMKYLYTLILFSY